MKKHFLLAGALIHMATMPLSTSLLIGLVTAMPASAGTPSRSSILKRCYKAVKSLEKGNTVKESEWEQLSTDAQNKLNKDRVGTLKNKSLSENERAFLNAVVQVAGAVQAFGSTIVKDCWVEFEKGENGRPLADGPRLEKVGHHVSPFLMDYAKRLASFQSLEKPGKTAKVKDAAKVLAIFGVIVLGADYASNGDDSLIMRAYNAGVQGAHNIVEKFFGSNDDDQDENDRSGNINDKDIATLVELLEHMKKEKREGAS